MRTDFFYSLQSFYNHITMNKHEDGNSNKLQIIVPQLFNKDVTINLYITFAF